MCVKKEEEKKKQKLYQNNSLGDLKLYQKIHWEIYCQNTHNLVVC